MSLILTMVLALVLPQRPTLFHRRYDDLPRSTRLTRGYRIEVWLCEWVRGLQRTSGEFTSKIQVHLLPLC